MNLISLQRLRDYVRSIFPSSMPTGFPDRFPDEIQLVDRRKYAAQAHGPKREWKVTGRTWKNTTGICLHQTACLLGEREERWDSVGAHIGITRGGKLIWLHDFDRVVAHGNGWNAQTVGIEVDGLYAGIEGDLSTVWDDPSTPAREQPMTLTLEAARTLVATIEWICDEVAAQGGNVRALVAHRQSSGSRRSDPGEAIWKAAAPIAKHLGLTDGGAGFKIGDGRPIPKEWDPSRSERY